jgi:hypothetical protein
MDPEVNRLISFIQHAIPGLEAGVYRLDTSQEITDNDGKVISDNTLTASYNFAVAGDRFRLKKPTELIFSVFPAENAAGKYSTVLPSVVFLKPTFPWERYPAKNMEEAYDNKLPAPGQDSDADLSTWLTIILLDEEDVHEYCTSFPAFTLSPVTATIKDLFPKNIQPSSTLGTNYSYFYQANSGQQGAAEEGSEVYLEPGEQLTDSIQILDIPLALFFRIAPTMADLQKTAHVRKVSLVNKATIPGVSDIAESIGSFSIVFGNRLPQEMKKTTAFLVSLEKMQDFLPTDPNGGVPDNKDGFIPDSSKMLRLAVLKSWNFYSTGQSATFIDQLNRLNQAAPPVDHKVNQDGALNTNLRLVPPSGAMPQVTNALQMGYVPLNHLLRAAEYTNGQYNQDKTVSWYRGPLIPYGAPDVQIALPVSSADQITRFDPTTGMLDTSYAAAWTIGRQLALQDSGFSTLLYNWKKGLSVELVSQLERQILMDAFGPALNHDDQKAVEKQEKRLAPSDSSGDIFPHKQLSYLSGQASRHHGASTKGLSLKSQLMAAIANKKRKTNDL